mmetsp:Transcript_75924/g.180477  ORF Transcript_75924/g.180477 Transcript_75924/m.180477 type:complete len:548 (-) Transcript_75924:103-1746(-)
MGSAESVAVQPVPRLAGSLGMEKPLQMLHETLVAADDYEVDDEDIDMLVALTRTSLLSHVCNPRDVRECAKQPPPRYKNRLLQDIATASLDLKPATVILHVYDLMDELQAANALLAFKVHGVTVGGAFHVGVEVYGNEWTYGTLGVCCEAPRTAAEHIYRCSICLGDTKLTQREVATVLHQMCQRWRGKDYELLDKNCCRFSSEFCERLGVGPMPYFLDRFARLLGGGRAVGKGALELGGKVRALVLGGGQASQVTSAASEVQVQNKLAAMAQQGPPTPSLPSRAPSRGGGEQSDVRGPLVFPIGAVVEYRSSTNGTWIPAKVLRYDARSRCYDLDCRMQAQPANIRWPQDRMPLQVAASPLPVPLRPSGVDDNVPPERPLGLQDAQPPSPMDEWPNPDVPQPSVPMIAGRDCEHACRGQHHGFCSRPAVRAASPEIVVKEKSAIGSPKLVVAPAAAQVVCDDLSESAAHKESAQQSLPGQSAEAAYAVGEIVEYESSQGWIPAKVFHFFPAKGVYDLDCKLQVPPQKLRKRQFLDHEELQEEVEDV